MQAYVDVRQDADGENRWPAGNRDMGKREPDSLRGWPSRWHHTSTVQKSRNGKLSKRLEAKLKRSEPKIVVGGHLQVAKRLSE